MLDRVQLLGWASFDPRGGIKSTGLDDRSIDWFTTTNLTMGAEFTVYPMNAIEGNQLDFTQDYWDSKQGRNGLFGELIDVYPLAGTSVRIRGTLNRNAIIENGGNVTLTVPIQTRKPHPTFSLPQDKYNHDDRGPVKYTGIVDSRDPGLPFLFKEGLGFLVSGQNYIYTA